PDQDAATIEAVTSIVSNAPDSVILGAFDPGLVGAVALYRDPRRKAAHKVHLWGLYVRPSHRGRGIGTRLLEAAIAHARTLSVGWVHLSVTSAAPGALRMYERAGFERWGTEPDALRHAGHSVDEHYLVLNLDGDGSAPVDHSGRRNSPM